MSNNVEHEMSITYISGKQFKRKHRINFELKERFS